MKVAIDPNKEERKDDTKCNDLELTMQTPSLSGQKKQDKNMMKLHPMMP